VNSQIGTGREKRKRKRGIMGRMKTMSVEKKNEERGVAACKGGEHTRKREVGKATKNEKLLLSSLSTMPLQSVIGRHVDTSAYPCGRRCATSSRRYT